MWKAGSKLLVKLLGLSPDGFCLVESFTIRRLNNEISKEFSPITLRGVTFPSRIWRTSMLSRLITEKGSVIDN
jgi:hypothetical protein